MPAQHGAWGFLVESILLGLLVAPSWAGLWLGVACIGAFLVQHPLIIVIKDFRRKRSFERTHLARQFLLLFSSVTLLFLMLAVQAAGLGFVPLLLLTLPLALTQLGFEVRNQNRHFVAEVAGALALGAATAMIALAANASWISAFILWLLIGLRVVPSILYVRTRLHWKHGHSSAREVPFMAHIFAVLTGLTLCVTGAVSVIYLVAVGLLFVRAIAGLWDRTQSVSARSIGVQEIAFGLLYVLLTAVALIGSGSFSELR
jgi:hypothetical protein